jgi:hypothetical protein
MWFPQRPETLRSQLVLLQNWHEQGKDLPELFEKLNVIKQGILTECPFFLLDDMARRGFYKTANLDVGYESFLETCREKARQYLLPKLRELFPGIADEVLLLAFNADPVDGVGMGAKQV